MSNLSGDVLICPDCRARVFATWDTCKFCGAVLRDTRIGATVDPDELVVPEATDPGDASTSWDAAPLASGAQDQGGAQDESAAHLWDSSESLWTSSAAARAEETPGSFDAGWDAAPGDAADAKGPLVPVDGADPTWAPGPAPAVDDGSPRSIGPASGSDDGWGEPSSGGFGDSSSNWIADSSPSGLDPVSWYTEPTPDTVSDAGQDTPIDHGDLGEDAEPAGPLFDPTAIFNGPEDPPPPPPPPPTPPPTNQDIERVAPAGEIDIHWQPAAADAWDSPVEPEGKPKRQAVLSREARLLVGALVLVLLVLVVGNVVRKRGSNHPDAWTPNVQGVADWVATARKSSFAHPVAVATLSKGQYDAAVHAAANPDKPKVHQQLVDQVAGWRALGGLDGNPTAELRAVAAQDPELGAFYDFAGKRLVLLAGADVGQLQQGAAGALSVALDDQQANLKGMDSTGLGEDTRFDVVFGTAALMRSDYAKDHATSQASNAKTSVAASDSYANADDAAIDAAATAPENFLVARRVLSVDAGMPFTKLVRTVHGKPAVNRLAGAAPASSQQVMFPLTYFDGQGPLTVDESDVPDGAEKISDGTIGAQSWYLLLAAHATGSNALDSPSTFANRWAGDAYVSYRKANGQVCVDDTIRGGDESQTALLAVALQTFEASLPSTQLKVHTTRNSIRVTACDPGSSADQGLKAAPKKMGVAIRTAATRIDLAAHYYFAGKKIPNGVNGPVFSPQTAWCMGDVAVGQAKDQQLDALAKRSGGSYKMLTLSAAKSCGATLADQLFVKPSTSKDGN